jgi:O-antigen/teichoic acid export membrane protein
MAPSQDNPIGEKKTSPMSLGERVFSFLPRPVTERINAIPFGRRLARGAFWTLAGTVAARILRIPISIVLARLMGPAQYGELGIATASIDLFSVFAGLGLGLTATKFIAELRVKDPARTGRIIAVSMVVGAVGGAASAIALLVLAPWLATHILAAPHLVVPLRIGSLALFFLSMNGAQNGALYGFEAFQVTAQLLAVVGLLDVPLMLGGYFLWGLNGVLCGMVVSRFTTWVLMRQAVKAQARRFGVPLIFGHWKQELAVVWHYSIPAALGGILVMPVNWACSALLVNQPRGYAEMGAYNAANQWYSALLFLPTVLGSGLLPILSDRMGERDGESSGAVLKVMFKLNGAILLPAVIGMSLCSPYIMRIYGAGYRDAWPTLIAVLWTAAVMGVIAPVGDVIAASGRMWLATAMNGGWAVVFVFSTLLLIHHGSLGLASSRLIAYVIHAGWTLAFAYFILRRHGREAKPQPELQSVS